MGIKNFNGYVNESEMNVKELPMFFSHRLTSLLNSIDSKISKDLLNLSVSGNKFAFSYADIGNDIDFISALPVNRMARMEGVTEKDYNNPSKDSVVWGEKYRQTFRIGAFVTRLLPQYQGTKDLENFVHLIKGKLDAGNYELKVVRGEEIRKWYHVDTYYNPTPGLVYRDDIEEGEDDPRTPLMKSCLKQPEKQTFFDIYTKNSDQIGMLIMLNANKKLVARAIIWFDCFVVDKPESPTKGVLMDRIYYTKESDVNIFIDYAKEHGWWYKPSQAKEVSTFVKDGEVCTRPVTTKLKNCGVFARYPFLDTMCFYTPETGRLSTSRGKPAPSPKSGDIMERYQLQKANGSAKRLARDK